MDDLSKAFLGFKEGLNKLVRTIISNPVDVEDIVHEAYLRSLEASKKQLIKSPKAFIARTARNLALNHIASASVIKTESLTHINPVRVNSKEASLEDQIEADRQFNAFCQAVGRLPTQCRKVFTLKQVYGLTQKEIAEKLGIGEKAVEYHVSKGLLQCRRYLRSVQSGNNSAKYSDSAKPEGRELQL